MTAKRGKIALDYSHKNKLTMESSSYSDFVQFLFNSGFRLGKIQAGFDSIEKLENYDLIMLTTPRSAEFTEEEINNVEEYVKEGGGLLIVSSAGGDYKNRTNLSQLTERFKFSIVPDEVRDSMKYANLQKRPIFSDFKPHSITNGVKKVVFSSACSLDVQEYIKKDQSINIDVLIKAGLNAWHKMYDGEGWIEEDIPNSPLMVAIEYYQGRVVAFGALSLFSSLGKEYGFYAHDNDVLIGNAITWLIEKESTEDKVLTLNINRELFQWSEKTVNEEQWGSFSDLVNVGLKHFKDNYREIMNELQARQLEKKKAYEKEEKEKKRAAEEEILNLIPKRKKEDLLDIISTLEEISGEKFELSIDFDELDLEEEELEEIEKSKEKKEVTNEDSSNKEENPAIETQNHKGKFKDEQLIEQFEKQTGKHAIWQGNITNQYKEWIKEKFGIEEEDIENSN
ncbi:MAG: hypothetical protein BAJALOKI3v1_290020 [Promethearchaeota archaeon]|nr:MAG: hypothetical protein BAJALOKI3v1_290020 [Candidatus Lokiarchaeota archaeon]